MDTTCIAVISKKGGTGKTTVALNLAAAAAQRRGTRVGVLDLDAAQGSITDWGAAREKGSALAGVTVTRGNHPVKRSAVERWARGFDVAVLDCPPQLGPTSRNAAAVATVVVITLEPSKLSVWSLPQTLKVLESALARRVVVLTRATPTLEVYKWAEATLLANAEKYRYEVAPIPIVSRPALYPKVAGCGEAAVTLYPDSAAADEIRTLFKFLMSDGTTRRKRSTHASEARERA